MAIIKKIKDFIDTRKFLSDNKSFSKYERTKKRFFEFLKDGWKIKDNYITKYNSNLECNLKIKDKNGQLILCIEDIPWKNTHSMESIKEYLFELDDTYDFDAPFSKKIIALLNKHWEEYLGDMHQDDDESDEDVYFREKVSKELMDIFIDYRFATFNNGFEIMKWGKGKYDDFIVVTGKRLSNYYNDMDRKDIIFGIQIGFYDEITKEDSDVLKNRLSEIDQSLKFNLCSYKRRDDSDTIYTFTFYYEFENFKALSDYLLKLGLLE